MEDVIKVECIKIGYRQTKEGSVVSYRIHPDDPNRGIADMPLGTRVMLGVVEIEE